MESYGRGVGLKPEACENFFPGKLGGADFRWLLCITKCFFMERNEELTKSIRRWIVFFMIALVFSGVTAFALETELGWLLKHWPAGGGGMRGPGGVVDGFGGGGLHGGGVGVRGWVQQVYDALKETNLRWPWLAYGYDWLAFAHLVIAAAFVGPLRDPVRNKWVIQFGMIACVMVFPLAFIAGMVMEISVYWLLIDCSFGAIGLVPLAICYYKIRLLEKECVFLHA